MNERLRPGMPNSVPWSIMAAWAGGMMDPPKMAMIRPAAPDLASSPSPSKQYRKWFGNMSNDMQAKPLPDNTCRKCFGIRLHRRSGLLRLRRRSSVTCLVKNGFHQEGADESADAEDGHSGDVVLLREHFGILLLHTHMGEDAGSVLDNKRST